MISAANQAIFDFRITGLIIIGALAIMGVVLHAIARKTANSDVLEHGITGKAEIVETRHDGDNCMYVTYRFTPSAGAEPVEVIKHFDKKVDLAPGSQVEVKYLAKFPTISLLVAYEKLHSAS
jgi:hypothetical protein